MHNSNKPIIVEFFYHLVCFDEGITRLLKLNAAIVFIAAVYICDVVHDSTCMSKETVVNQTDQPNILFYTSMVIY